MATDEGRPAGRRPRSIRLLMITGHAGHRLRCFLILFPLTLLALAARVDTGSATRSSERSRGSNGLEAMREPHAGARTLVIRTARDGAAALRVTVQDSGPGIAEKDLGHIFEPLYTTESEGLGMGLAIVRTIVRAHGGTVGAEI